MRNFFSCDLWTLMKWVVLNGDHMNVHDSSQQHSLPLTYCIMIMLYIWVAITCCSNSPLLLQAPTNLHSIVHLVTHSPECSGETSVYVLSSVVNMRSAWFHADLIKHICEDKLVVLDLCRSVVVCWRFTSHPTRLLHQSTYLFCVYSVISCRFFLVQCVVPPCLQQKKRALLWLGICTLANSQHCLRGQHQAALTL